MWQNFYQCQVFINSSISIIIFAISDFLINLTITIIINFISRRGLSIFTLKSEKINRLSMKIIVVYFLTLALYLDKIFIHKSIIIIIPPVSLFFINLSITIIVNLVTRFWSSFSTLERNNQIFTSYSILLFSLHVNKHDSSC